MLCSCRFVGKHDIQSYIDSEELLVRYGGKVSKARWKQWVPFFFFLSTCLSWVVWLVFVRDVLSLVAVWYLEKKKRKKREGDNEDFHTKRLRSVRHLCLEAISIQLLSQKSALKSSKSQFRVISITPFIHFRTVLTFKTIAVQTEMFRLCRTDCYACSRGRASNLFLLFVSWYVE